MFEVVNQLLHFARGEHSGKNSKPQILDRKAHGTHNYSSPPVSMARVFSAISSLVMASPSSG